jgi:hypothetical protein
MPTNISAVHAQKASSFSWFAQASNDPDLIATVLFCAVGLLVTAVVMLCFPDFGAMIAQYNQF